MIKTLKNLLKQDKERYSVPRKVQDVIPIQRIWKDGIFQVGSRFSKTYKFTDINYLVASREDKESMFLASLNCSTVWIPGRLRKLQSITVG